MADLRVTLCGVPMQSPVIAASGTFGFGQEFSRIVDMRWLGAISGKGLTLEGKAGNEGERLYETPAALSIPSACRTPACAISSSMSFPP